MKMSAEHARDGTWGKLADGPEQVGLGTRDSQKSRNHKE